MKDHWRVNTQVRKTSTPSITEEKLDEIGPRLEEWTVSILSVLHKKREYEKGPQELLQNY
jgi:hypothetical protein